MLGTTVIIPTALVPQMGGGNVRSSPTFHFFFSLSIRVCVRASAASARCPQPDAKARRFPSFFSLAQEEKARVVQTLLFVAGINTLIQSFLGTRLPAVMGGSYTFVAPTISIILAGRYSGIADPHEARLAVLPASSSKFRLSGLPTNLFAGCRNSCASCGARKARSLWPPPSKSSLASVAFGALSSGSSPALGPPRVFRSRCFLSSSTTPSASANSCCRLLSPLSAAPLVALVGFGLYELGFPSVRPRTA
jgi:hypothetical protein